MEKQSINIVWLKRDLRINHHAALHAAEQATIPYLIVFLFEPNIIAHPDTSLRHLQFQYHSIMAMNKALAAYQYAVHICYGEAPTVFGALEKQFKIQHIYSFQETGIQLTYDRDIALQSWCTAQKIIWKQFQRDGVVRGINNRTGWDKAWYTAMAQPLLENSFTVGKAATYYNEFSLPTSFKQSLMEYDKQMQPAGEANAWKYLQTFLKERHVNYSKHISKPLLSRTSCARLSPYLAFGNIAVAQVVYAAQMAKPSANKFALSSFLNRVKWRCHFIQKFEQECSYETQFVNKGYNELIFEKNERYIKAWETGYTGYPLVDACMRCLIATGWINFRIRAMLVSFFCHQLLQDWRWGVYHIAQQFLDYEPGIHYTQFQMQAGTTGVNTVRIYNPIKQSEEQDADGAFIKQWLPELINIPTDYIHQPWLMNAEQQQQYQCIIGEHYPAPIVDIKEATKAAKDLYWGMRKSETVKADGKRIVQQHARPAAPLKQKRVKKEKPKQPEQLKLL